MGKRIYCVVSVAVVIALVFAAAVIVEERYMRSRERDIYPKGVIVEELDYYDDSVIVSDANGFLWSFQGCEDYEVGDILALIMDGRGTPEIFDDAIVDVRCAY